MLFHKRRAMATDVLVRAKCFPVRNAAIPAAKLRALTHALMAAEITGKDGASLSNWGLITETGSISVKLKCATL